MTPRPAINSLVTTPNGPGRLVSTYYLHGDSPMEPPTGLLVRHPKEVDIDTTLCAALCSETNVSGWLVVYKAEELIP